MAQMNKEHEQKQRQGNVWLGHFIANAIDEALQSKIPKGKHSPDGLYGEHICISDMILAPLIVEKIQVETLEHLRIEIHLA